MAKRTAIIDLGSNSVRMAVYEKTSRYGFHLIKELKSRVRIGEGAYEKNGMLQPHALERTLETLKAFQTACNALKCNKIICVATSALRDAPNGLEFTKRVFQETKLRLKVIKGTQEAYYGAIAASNLLPRYKEATTVDIGGGSTELAKIVDGKIVQTISLDIGTVRLKELFFDTKKPLDELNQFINQTLKSVPDSFQSPIIIGIGGTLRALSNALMEKSAYPLKTVHGFSYDANKNLKWIETISCSNIRELKSFGFKKDRLDTIREGSAIFAKLILLLKAQKIITSGVGVREGVFLSNLLRSNNYQFPANFNPSIRSLIDRFASNPKHDNFVASNALKLFEALKPLHNIDDTFKTALLTAGKLHSIGRALSFYQEHLHGFYFILNNLNFGFTHQQKLLIALLVKTNHHKLPSYADLKEYEELLPDYKIVSWLSFILAFSKSLNIDYSMPKIEFIYKNHTLHVKSQKKLYLAKEAARKLVKPTPFAIAFR
jgi:exopolyphosphatase/guanosine-5'-triphosphate,3'-diphosphate pyrophosphatase